MYSNEKNVEGLHRLKRIDRGFRIGFRLIRIKVVDDARTENSWKISPNEPENVYSRIGSTDSKEFEGADFGLNLVLVHIAKEWTVCAHRLKRIMKRVFGLVSHWTGLNWIVLIVCFGLRRFDSCSGYESLIHSDWT